VMTACFIMSSTHFKFTSNSDFILPPAIDGIS
jgi:hypothetical protein